MRTKLGTVWHFETRKIQIKISRNNFMWFPVISTLYLIIWIIRLSQVEFWRKLHHKTINPEPWWMRFFLMVTYKAFLEGVVWVSPFSVTDVCLFGLSLYKDREWNALDVLNTAVSHWHTPCFCLSDLHVHSRRKWLVCVNKEGNADLWSPL